SFRTPFNPFRAEHMHDDYTEGNGWQYTFMVPHDVPGLIDIFGGKDRFLQKLDSLFIAEGYMGENHSDVTGLIGQYAHGNEPCHHVAYMYDYAGRPDKCQRLVRTIMDSLYFDKPDGLCGNEDVGQMSSWYVLSALGLYQVDPCGGDFWLGSPAVKEAVINGNFKIVAHNNSAENVYVKWAKLNGAILSEPRISYEDIMKGGTLEFEMTDTPVVK
nr:glycoside hydrolase family 92 protein [Bacteroidales bacterium]